MSQALPPHLRITSLSTNMTVRDNNLRFVTDEIDDDDDNIRAGTQNLPKHDLLCPVGEEFDPIGNVQIDKLALNESSIDLKSNSLHEYAQLCGYLQTRHVPGGVAPTVNGPDEEQLNPDLTLFMKNMQKVDAARQMLSPRAKPQQTMLCEDIQTERFVIELESEGTDFHTVFKNQQVAVNQNKDLLIHSIVANLKIRGFILNEQVISYFSVKTKSFVAAAKRPIPTEAVIPGDDIEKNGRLTLKIWPPEKLPESLLMDLDCRPKSRTSQNLNNNVLNMFKDGLNGHHNAVLLDATLKSSHEDSVNKALLSLSSGTSYGKEVIYENTIEQILGNIERSCLGDKKEHSNNSFDQSKHFRKQIEAKIFGQK